MKTKQTKSQFVIYATELFGLKPTKRKLSFRKASQQQALNEAFLKRIQIDGVQYERKRHPEHQLTVGQLDSGQRGIETQRGYALRTMQRAEPVDELWPRLRE